MRWTFVSKITENLVDVIMFVPDGEAIESALDHIYRSQGMEGRVSTSKLEEISTDHTPILAEIRIRKKERKEPKNCIQEKHEEFYQRKMERMPHERRVGETRTN